MDSPNQSKTFIIYLSADGKHAPQVKLWLEEANHQVRQAAVPRLTTLDQAEAYENGNLLPQIQWCDVLVVLISPAARNDAVIAWAIECAQRLGKRVIGIWLEDANYEDLPGALDDLADAVVPANPAGVVGAVEGSLNGIRRPDGSPRAERAIARHNC